MSKAVRSFTFSLVSLVCALSARPAYAQIRSSMSVFSDSFISPDFEATKKTNYQFVGAQLKTEEKSPDAFVMDVTGAVAIGEPLLNYLNVTEFYYALPIADDQTLTFGRRKMAWSDLDARWQLGVWEPVFEWNPLSPERQGLTGLFWDLQREDFGLTLYASPIFLPNQGPSYEIQNGEFVKSNPWFHQPPDAIHIFNQTTQIEYHMKRPEDSQVVFQTSYGAKIHFGDPKDLFFQLSEIYKPVNELAIGYDGVLDISIDRGIVDLQPEVVYHSLTGADLTYKLDSVKVGASVIQDHPSNMNPFDAQLTRPIYHDALLASGFIEYETRFLDFHYQRLDITGGNVTEVGPLADPNRRPLMTRYPYRQANQIGMGGHVGLNKVRRIAASISYTRSDKNDFSMIKFNGNVKLSKLWNIYSEMQLIDAGALTATNQNDIAQYANNDRFLIGATYVF